MPGTQAGFTEGMKTDRYMALRNPRPLIAYNRGELCPRHPIQRRWSQVSGNRALRPKKSDAQNFDPLPVIWERPPLVYPCLDWDFCGDLGIYSK